MAPRTRPLTVVVGADTKPFQKGMKDADKSLDRFGKNASAKSRAATAGFKGVGIAATASVAGVGALAVAGKRFVDAYAEAEKSDARMQTQLKASNISYKAHADQIDRVIQKTSRLAAVDDEDLQDAFTNIVRVTGNVNQSLKLTQVAADIAAAKHIDLGKAGELVGKVAGGNVGILSRYGIQIDKGASSTQALGILQQKFAGQAKAFGDTNAGASQRLSVAWENLQEKIGSKLAPALTKATNSASKFLTEMENGTGAGGRFVEKLENIRDEIQPIATWLVNAGKAVGRFVEKHPEAGKLALGIAAVGTAIKAIRFAGAISGFSAFLSAGKTAATGLVKVMRGAGARAGEAAAANAAEGMANQMPKSLDARKGKFSAAGKGVGRAVGISLGTAMGAAAIGVAGAALLKWLSGANDKLQAEGGIKGAIGWLSNAGEFAARNAPGPVGDVSRAIIGNGSRRAGGGRIPGAPVAADTYPALLSPQEFVVTGDGERQLEAMTFPGVLNVLEGTQAPHFRGGGRMPRRMASGGRVGTAIQAARAAGFKGRDLVNMIAIAGRESKYDPTATNFKYPDHSIGLWQINQLAHKGKYGSDQALMNPLTNAKAAYALFKAAGLSPWNHKGGPLGGTNVAAARRAVLGSGTAAGGGGTKAGGPRPSGDQIFAGFQAAAQGESLRQFLSGALDYVGESNRVPSTPLASAAGSASGGPPAVQAMLARARKYAFGPYDYGGGHGGFGKPGGKGGFDCSGYVSAILGPGVLSSPMAVVQPMAGALQSGEGKYVTVGMRGSSGKSAHTMIKIGNSYYESGGGHGAAKVKGWSGSFSKYHPAGLRRGGRVRGMRGGGRGLHRYATGRPSGTVRSVGRGPSQAQIGSLLSTIGSGNPGSIKAALRKAQTYMAANPSIGALRGWINAANRRIEKKGISAAGQRGLQSFTALAQNELGRQLQNPILAVDTAEGAFDQAGTDLGNRLAADRADEAATAGAQGALATQQLQTLYANRATIATQLNRARRSGSKKTVQALEGRLSQADSAILAKRAEVVGYQDQYTAATTPEAGEVDDTQQRLIDAIKDMTARLTDVGDQLKRQTDVAIASSGTQQGQLTRALLDIVAGGLGDRAIGRGRTAGTGAIAVNY